MLEASVPSGVVVRVDAVPSVQAASDPEISVLSPSLQSWENRIWQNSIVQTVQKRVRKVFAVEGSPPVAARTRTSLKRSSSSANMGVNENELDGGYHGDMDRTSASLRKAISQRKERIEQQAKRRNVEMSE